MNVETIHFHVETQENEWSGLPQGLNRCTGIKVTNQNNNASKHPPYIQTRTGIQPGQSGARTYTERANRFHFMLQIRCPALSLREAHWQMSVPFTHFWLASSTILLPPACVTSALTSHVTSGRTSEGIPVAGQTSDDFQRLRLQLPNGRKTHFLDVLGLEIKLKTDSQREDRAVCHQRFYNS